MPKSHSWLQNYAAGYANNPAHPYLRHEKKQPSNDDIIISPSSYTFKNLDFTNQELAMIEFIKKTVVARISDEDSKEVFRFAVNSRLEFIKKLNNLIEFNKDMFDNHFFIELSKAKNFEVLCWFLDGHSCKGSIDIDTLFSAAICTNQWPIMCICMARKYVMTPCSITGNTPLPLAAVNSNPATIKFLFDNKHNALNKKNRPQDLQLPTNTHEGNYPANLATMASNIDALRFFHSYGVDLTIQNEFGDTPLHIAISEGKNKFKITKFLCRHKGALNKKNNAGDTPLHLAVNIDNTEAVNELCKKGADLETKNNHGHTPLHTAARLAKFEIVTTLCKYNADSNAKTKSGNTPLHYAVKSGDAKIIEYLHAEGADLHARNNFGHIPMHYTKIKKIKDLLSYLEKRTADSTQINFT